MLDRLAFMKLTTGALAHQVTRPMHLFFPNQENIGNQQTPEQDYEKGHEYVRPIPFDINPNYLLQGVINDFLEKPVNRDAPIDIESLLQDKDAVILTYGSDWCRNTQHQVGDFNQLYEMHSKRLEILLRTEYSDDHTFYVDDSGILYPSIVGSDNPGEDEEARRHTNHFRLRSLYGDKRKWGTPTSLVFVKGHEFSYLFLGEISPDTIKQFLQ